MNGKLKLAIVRLILIQLIPIVGVIFFEWQLFEIGVTYILETMAIYVAYELDHYFIDKRTRFLFPMALIQFALTMVTFSGMMFGSAMIIYIILTPPISNPSTNQFVNEFLYRLEEMEMGIAFAGLLVIELITYYIRKAKDTAHIANSTWRVVRRILYSHLYIVACLVILSFFTQNLFVFIPFFIGLKIAFDYSAEDERIFKALWLKFLETKFGSQFKSKKSRVRD